MIDQRKARNPGRIMAYSPLWQKPFRVFSEQHLDQLQPLRQLSEEQRFAMKVVAKVLPFRVNQYVIDELIDWENIPHDPVFQLTFPQQEMLEPHHFDHIAGLMRSGSSEKDIREAAFHIHQELNHHPADQATLNVPVLDGISLQGMQHKYERTVLFFPSQGQTCHSFCTYCFRWPQFVGDHALRIASKETSHFLAYLKQHREVTDLLITGGDPMVMRTESLGKILEPLLAPEYDHIESIRFGTKALSFWPYRFFGDKDSGDLLRLFEKLIQANKHVAIMAHISHGNELRTSAAVEAIKRIQGTGAVIRSQAPVLNHINADPEVWAEMWQNQVRLGIIPYYMFMARDTGSRRHFEIPIVQALDIYQKAIKKLSGLARKARGPSMSSGPGKVEVQGVAEVKGEKVFIMRFLQSRNPEWVDRPFFAKYDTRASWLDDLKPAFGEERFFFEEEYEAMRTEAES
jgi:KamA family protein